MLDHALLTLSVAQDMLESKAVLAGFALEAFRRICRSLCKGDLLGRKSGLGRKLGQQRSTAEALLKRASRTFYMH